MASYRFHCVSRDACIFDAVGLQVRTQAEIAVEAARKAEEIMRSEERWALGTDWSKWWVSVHDLSGRRVLAWPFVPAEASLALAA